MSKLLTIYSFFFLFLISHPVSAQPTTTRIAQFSNEKVAVWETIIYPGSKQILKMHRHDRDRVVVAFNNGTLKITNNKGKIHYFKLEKDKAYFLTKDVRNETHIDENISGHPIKVMIIELV